MESVNYVCFNQVSSPGQAALLIIRKFQLQESVCSKAFQGVGIFIVKLNQ